MPNRLEIIVHAPDDLLNAGMYGANAIVRVQSGAAEAGPFANLTTAAIVTGTTVYVVHDASGSGTTWYRTRYENAGGTVLGDWSAAFLSGASGILSLAEVHLRLDLDTTTTEYNGFLLDAITAVTATFHRRTGRWFLPDPTSGTVTYSFDVPWPSRTLVIRRGIRSVTTLEYATATGGDYATIPATAYYLDPPEQDRDPGDSASQITLSDVAGYQFYPGQRTARVTGGFGMDAPPPDLVQIAGNAIVRLFRARQAGQADTVGTNAMGQSIILRQLSPSELSTLDSYRWSRAD